MRNNYYVRSDQEIGRTLQSVREERGLTRRQVCHLIGYMSVNAAVNLYHWEHGDFGIPKLWVRRLSEALSIPCSLLLP